MLKLRAFITAMLLTFGVSSMVAQTPTGPVDERWGDQGDGTFANPVLNADYSDPDVIRVGNKYYMICSPFHFMGMPVLESDDMVNWKIISQIYSHIDLEGYGTMSKYGQGAWAPALRYHDGLFYMYVCTPKEGLFMSTAEKPEGPWQPLHCVKARPGWEAPCPFWDEDGNAYLVHSQVGAGPIIIHRMSPDGKTLLDEGRTLYTGHVAEGPKMFKKDGFYYISIPEGGVPTGWQTILKSKHIDGPYAARRILEKGSTPINGPHQGAFVDTPDGEWWFYHFQSADPLGRVVHLQPVKWIDGYPFVGTDYDGNGIGEPMKICAKPNTGVNNTPFAPQTSDDFSNGIGIQWQFCHNPDTSKVSTNYRHGWLRMDASKAPNIRKSVNQLTQKTMGYKGEVLLVMDPTLMQNGGRAGLECIGKNFCGAGVQKNENGLSFYFEKEGIVADGEHINENTGVVYIKLSIDAVSNTYQFYVSTDGTNYAKCGDSFAEGSRDWKGARVGIYSYNTIEDAGAALFDKFTYTTDGPQNTHFLAEGRVALCPFCVMGDIVYLYERS